MSSQSFPHHCICCGAAFHPATPDIVLCPACRQSARETALLESSQTEVEPTKAAQHPTISQIADADIPLDWKPGDILLNLYEVKGELGRGGMGAVYRVRHLGWNLDLAVKSPLPIVLTQSIGSEQFIREAEAWVDLGLHPHIVTCYYVRKLGGIPRVFAECVEGGTLKDWIAQGKLRTLEQILDAAIQFAWGLGYSHQQGLVHQDVKPHNALMTPEGVLKVTDFGLVGAKGFTREYCSPEQSLGKAVDPRSDIWSWGLVALEMFMGESPWFYGTAAPHILADYLSSGGQADGLPRMPDAVSELLRECFHDEPARRPASMDEAAERLAVVYEQEVGQPYPRQKPEAAELRADSLNNKAVSLLDLGREEEAVNCWEKALKVDPAHLETNFNYGYYRWQKAELPGSRFIDEFHNLKGKHLSRPEYWSMLGWLYLEQGNVEEVERLRSEIRDKTLVEVLYSGKHPRVTIERSVHGVGQVQFSPDVQWIVFQEGLETNQPAVVLLNLKTGERRRYLCGGLGWPRAVAFSPKADFIIWGCKKGIVRWDFSRKRAARLLGATDQLIKANDVKSLVFSSDGQYVYSVDDDGRIAEWDTANWKMIRQWDGGKGTESLAISPSRQHLLSSGYDNLIRLWDVRSNRVVSRMLVDDPISVRFVPNGNFALSGNGDSTLCLWNLTDGQPAKWFKAHMGYIVSVDVSADGRFAISGSADQTARFWEIKTGKEIRCLVKHPDQVTSVCFSPDSKKAVTCGGGAFYIWDIDIPGDWKGITVYPVLCRPERYTEIADRQFKARRLLTSAHANISAGNFQEAQNILRQVQTIPDYEHDHKVIEWLADCGQKGIRIKLREGLLFSALDARSGDIHAVSISSDGKYIISGGEDKTVCLWDSDNGNQLYRWEGHRGAVRHLSISQNGRLALSACGNTLIVWDLFKGKEAARLEGRRLQYFSGYQFAALAPQGRLVLTQSGDPLSGETYAYLWDFSNGEIKRFRWAPKNTAYQKPETCVFSPDERYVVSANNTHSLSIWDLRAIVRGFSGDNRIPEVHCISGSMSKGKIPGRVTCLNISPDCHLVYVGCHDDHNGIYLSIWDLDKAQEIRCLEGHKGIIRSIVPSPDGKFLITGSDDQTVRVWDLSNHEEICCLQGHTHRVSSVAISADGRYVVSGSWDGTIRIWALDWDYAFPHPADWDEGAQPYLETFLAVHTPCGSDNLTRLAEPQWNETDFHNLLKELGYRGYGWLRPEGVRRKLEEIARNIK